MGRYRVRLPFDLDEWSPGGESRPIRLAKPYAGPAYGQHFPLHKDTEVMLSFVQGHPDRPYISGVMHNSVRPDHVPADWNSRNVIRTWANNKLRMEDKRGENGEGFELRTDSWGAIRAGKGLFLSSDGQNGAAGNVLDMNDAISQLEQVLSLAKSLNKAAAVAQNEATQSKALEGRLKDAFKGLKGAALIQSAPEGIASATPQSQLHTAGEHLHFVSGGDTAVGAGQNFTAHAMNSVNLKYKNYDYYYDIWSNIHYGYVGLSVGFSRELLLKGASTAQVIDSLGRNTEDPPDDVTAINIGFSLFRKFGIFAEKLTHEDILKEIHSQHDSGFPNSRKKHICLERK